MFKLTVIIGVILFSGHFSFGQCNGAGNNTYDFDFTNDNTTCGNPNGSWWQVGGDTCQGWTNYISLDPNATGCSSGSNGTQFTMRYDKTGQQLLATDYIKVHIYSVLPDISDSTLEMADTIWGNWQAQSGNSNVRDTTYTVPIAHPNLMKVHFEMYTHASNHKFKIGENPNNTCINCGFFSFFLPITIHNERLHHQDGQLHYTFDLEDTDLEVAAISLGRSTDGTTFHPVSFTDPRPTGSQYTGYRLVDQDPELPAYYRAELLTHDGDIKYGRVLLAEKGQAPNPLLHPNPVSRGGKLVLEYADSFTQGVLADIHGRNSYSFPLQANENGTASISIPSHLPAGIYMLRLNNQFQTAHYRIVVSE